MYLRAPPPVIGAVAALAMWAVADVRTAALAFPGQLAAALALAATGAAIDVASMIAFRRARTTINPLRPDRTSALVVSGPFRFSRNPMYLGLACLLAGWAVWLGDPLNLLVLAAFVALVTALQIVPEERALASKFGQAYAAYRARVRRWI